MKIEIKNEWIYDQSPDEVWEYLTQADLIALWLMPNDFQPTPGHEFQFRTKPIPSLDLDGIFYCKVLEIVPLKKLSYSWRGGSVDGVFSLDTICEWTLEPYRNGTTLRLEHSGFKEANLAIFTGMTDGWQTNIQKMANHINSTKS